MALTGEMGWCKTGDSSTSEARTLQPTSNSILRSLIAGYQISQVSVGNKAVAFATQYALAHLMCCTFSVTVVCLVSYLMEYAGGDVDAQIKTVIQLLLRRGLIIRIDRMFKKAKPGKKRLAKWPKKMVPVRDRDLQVYTHDHLALHHTLSALHPHFTKG